MGIINLVTTFATVLLISTAAFLIGGALIDESRHTVGGLSIAGLSIALGIVALAGLPSSAIKECRSHHRIFSDIRLGFRIRCQNVVARLTSNVEHLDPQTMNGRTRSKLKQSSRKSCASKGGSQYFTPE